MTREKSQRKGILCGNADARVSGKVKQIKILSRGWVWDQSHIGTFVVDYTRLVTLELSLEQLTNIDTLFPFSSENEDKVFNPGILSSPLLSHRGKFTSDFSEIPMMIFGGNVPVSDILIASDLEDSRARGFVHRPLNL
ncbi:hypothetical protein Tco_1277974 [Tanacetum coccineum]